MTLGRDAAYERGRFRTPSVAGFRTPGIDVNRSDIVRKHTEGDNTLGLKIGRAHV